MSQSNRDEIIARLTSKPWFQASDQEIQRQLLGLPQEGVSNCFGHLEHLSKRETTEGGVTVLGIKDVLIPDGRIYGILSNFSVESVRDKKSYAYQYYGWRQGPKSGAKGIVLVQNKSKQLTHALILSGYAFGPAKVMNDLLGGFAEATETGIAGALKNFERELCEELGVQDLRIAEIIPLGSICPDPGMTNNEPDIFAAIIDASEADRVPIGEHRNPDPRETRKVPNLVPIDSFWGKDGLVMKNQDGFFLACVSRLVALGILKAP